jgi:hypothetical protein
MVADAADPQASLASWGIWSTTDPKQAQQRRAQLLRSNGLRNWRLPLNSPVGVYRVGS